jgi:hypothetical protein
MEISGIRRQVTVFLFILLVAGTWSSVNAYDSGESYTGVKLGFIGSGGVDVDHASVEQQAGPSASFFFDLPLGSRLHYGLSTDLHKMSWTGERLMYQVDETGWLLDLGVNLKGDFMSDNSPLGFRPGVGVGVGFLGKMDELGVAGSSYIILRTFAEVVYALPSDLMFVFEGGIWYAPSGGDNLTDVSIGPLFLLRGGVMF